MKTDYELVKEKNYYELWERYSPLFLTFYNKVPLYVRNQLWQDFDEFKQDCYPVLVAAVDSEKLGYTATKNIRDSLWNKITEYYN